MPKFALILQTTSTHSGSLAINQTTNDPSKAGSINRFAKPKAIATLVSILEMIN
jgi:hypothetical protein